MIINLYNNKILTKYKINKNLNKNSYKNIII